jgi:hypothetical protein
MQILQFIIDIFLFHFGCESDIRRHVTPYRPRKSGLTSFTLFYSVYQHFAFTYWPHLPHIGDCTGDATTAIFGGVLITSFLGLFVNFYVQTYTKADGDGIGKNKDKIQVTRNPGSGRKGAWLCVIVMCVFLEANGS